MMTAWIMMIVATALLVGSLIWLTRSIGSYLRATFR
jgi:hypothetical protein